MVSMACSWQGIPLERKKHIPISSLNECNLNSEIRTYRVLFLLPFYHHNLNEKAESNSSEVFVVESNSYAKPWDIVFTTLGFLISFNSSTESRVICPKQLVIDSIQKQIPSSVLPTKLSYWQVNGNPSPIHSIQFSPDDYQLTGEIKEKLVSIAREVLKSETNFKIILVGKSLTSGDIAYQTRLVKRRFEEIRQVLAQESIDESRVLSFIAEREMKETSSERAGETSSSIFLYLAKD